MIKAVIFDLDQTLLDREASMQPCLLELYQRYNSSDAPFERFRQRFKALDQFGYGGKEHLFKVLVEEFQLRAKPQTLIREFRAKAWRHCQLFDDAEVVLQALRSEGYKLAIITNGSRQSQRAKLRSTGLLSQVDVVLISGEEGIKKPHPAIFERGAARLKVDVRDCIFVGDNPRTDMMGAKQVGMKAIWVERRGRTWTEEIELRADWQVSCLKDILEIDLMGDWRLEPLAV